MLRMDYSYLFFFNFQTPYNLFNFKIKIHEYISNQKSAHKCMTFCSFFINKNNKSCVITLLELNEQIRICISSLPCRKHTLSAAIQGVDEGCGAQGWQL